jgi:hypothetical protein
VRVGTKAGQAFEINHVVAVCFLLATVAPLLLNSFSFVLHLYSNQIGAKFWEVR